MKQGKYLRKETPVRRRSGYKLTVILLVLTLLLGGAIGGTLAYLTTQATAVKNTFTVGNVGTLTLSNDVPDGGHIIIPGYTITMNPTVSYTGNNIPAYVFVKVDVTGDDGATGWDLDTATNTYTTTDDFMSWSVDAANWTWVTGNVFVYKDKLAANVGLSNVAVVTNNTITVSPDVTESNIGELKTLADTVQFTAWAIQADGFADAASAWTAAGTN